MDENLDTTQIHPTELLPAAIIPLNFWFGLEVGPVEESADLVELSLPYRPAGALGFLKRRDKDGDRLYRFPMVFKDDALRDAVLAAARKGDRYSDVSAFSLSETPQRIRTYRFFVFETFWRHLHSRKRSVWVHERVMNSAPPCLRMPYAPEHDPVFSRELITRDEQDLLNHELFESDRYPPLINRSATDKGGPLNLDKLSCGLAPAFLLEGCTALFDW
jgi:hypothetical protein